MALYIQQTGKTSAPAIVFLHGVGTSGWMWQRQIAALSNFHCISIDLPGHGKSNHVEWQSFAKTAEHVAGVIRENARDERAHIVGLSLGGYVALALMNHHKSVESAIISGVTAEPMPNRIFLKPQLWLTRILFNRDGFANSLAKRYGLSTDDATVLKENLRAMSMETYRQIMEEAVVFSVPQGLQHNTIPALIVAGGNESEIILKSLKDIPEHVPHTQGYLAPGYAHGWNIEAPTLFTEMIQAWIARTPLPKALINANQ